MTITWPPEHQLHPPRSRGAGWGCVMPSGFEGLLCVPSSGGPPHEGPACAAPFATGDHTLGCAGCLYAVMRYAVR